MIACASYQFLRLDVAVTGDSIHCHFITLDLVLLLMLDGVSTMWPLQKNYPCTRVPTNNMCFKNFSLMVFPC